MHRPSNELWLQTETRSVWPSLLDLVIENAYSFTASWASVTALHQGAPGQARQVNDLAGRSTAVCFASVIVWQWNNLSGVGGLCVLMATIKKRLSTFLKKKVHPGDLARGCSDLERPGSFDALAAATAELRNPWDFCEIPTLMMMMMTMWLINLYAKSRWSCLLPGENAEDVSWDAEITHRQILQQVLPVDQALVIIRARWYRYVAVDWHQQVARFYAHINLQ